METPVAMPPQASGGRCIDAVCGTEFRLAGTGMDIGVQEWRSGFPGACQRWEIHCQVT